MDVEYIEVEEPDSEIIHIDENYYTLPPELKPMPSIPQHRVTIADIKRIAKNIHPAKAVMVKIWSLKQIQSKRSSSS